MPRIDVVARMKIHRKSKPKELSPDEEGGELNIIPYLDIVVNIIMFLLMTTVVALSVTNINVSSPSAGGGGGGGEENPLNLTVTITDAGFTVAASGGVLTRGCQQTGPPPTVPKAGANYDYAALTRCVSEIKRRFEDETKVILAANARIPYETVIDTLDAIRGDSTKVLFPDVMLSAGIQ